MDRALFFASDSIYRYVSYIHISPIHKRILIFSERMRRMLAAPPAAVTRNAQTEISFCLFRNVLHFYQSYRCLERGLMILYPALERSEVSDESFEREVKLRLL